MLIRSCQKISSLGYNGTNKEENNKERPIYGSFERTN
jgi:hypothetical protein